MDKADTKKVRQNGKCQMVINAGTKADKKFGILIDEEILAQLGRWSNQ